MDPGGSRSNSGLDQDRLRVNDIGSRMDLGIVWTESQEGQTWVGTLVEWTKTRSNRKTVLLCPNGLV